MLVFEFNPAAKFKSDQTFGHQSAQARIESFLAPQAPHSPLTERDPQEQHSQYYQQTADSFAYPPEYSGGAPQQQGFANRYPDAAPGPKSQRQHYHDKQWWADAEKPTEQILQAGQNPTNFSYQDARYAPFKSGFAPETSDANGRWCPTPDSLGNRGCCTISYPNISYDDGKTKCRAHGSSLNESFG